MPSNVDHVVLSLSNSPWSYPYWTSRQFLMYELASNLPVGYALDRIDIREALQWQHIFSSDAAAPFAAPKNLALLSRRWPRTYRYNRLDQVFLNRYTKSLQRFLDSGQARQRIVYAWHPTVVQLVKNLSYETLVYHPYDMFSHFVSASSQVTDAERELCDLADILITPHHKVGDELKHPNTHVINNGVFLPAFDAAAASQMSAVKDRKGKVVIGSLGVVNDKVDFSLLLEVFSKRPDWKLQYVGFEGGGEWRQSAEYKELVSLSNVRFESGVPFNKVAEVISGFDVGVIPYALSRWAKFIESPLKLYQYWACGVPAVSSALPKLRTEPGVLEVCTSADEWVAGIERQLAARSVEQCEKLVNRAKQHSWHEKAREIHSLVCR